MTMPEGYTLTALTAERLRDVLTLDSWAFPTGDSLDDLEALPTPITWERAFGVEREGGTGLAAMHAAHPLRAYPVPGAEVPCGWLTWVSVHPGHRRRGLLRAMVEHHLADCAAHGEAISGLTAAEPAIYGRFGYGMAAPALGLTVPRGPALRDVPGSAELEVEITELDPSEHGDLISRAHHEQAALPAGIGRPGWATWETPQLRDSRLDDPPVFRAGREPLRILIARRGQQVRGYATFRRTSEWKPEGPSGTVQVNDLVALEPAASHRIWSVLLDLDLTHEVTVRNIPVDDPITWLLLDLRRAKAVYRDHTWLRLVDVPAALAQRRYPAEVNVVLEVTDGLVPANAGRWRLQAPAWGQGSVAAAPRATPDLSMDVRDLSAAYLGATSLASLAQAGLVKAADGAALARAAVAFSWPVTAGASWVF